MKKVEILSNDDIRDLEYRINKFIAEYNVVDIQFQMAVGYYNHMNYSVMMVYEEKE